MVNEQKGLKAIYSGDGVHPNKAGYEVMNPLAEKAIAKILSTK
jgi:lysophospholipase L1-like esterase